MSWAQDIVPHVKALHAGFLALWVAGLFALPRMMAQHRTDHDSIDYGRIRQATHFGYVWALTPAAVLTIVTGSLLLFLREVFVLWLMAKLVLVAGMVGLHAWIGHRLIRIAESDGSQTPPRAAPPAVLLGLLVLGILTLVLAKPDLGAVPVPDWLTTPLGRQLPFDVPSR